MTDWFWIRHGPTHERSFVGWRDVPADLSDQAQIDRVAGFLPAGAPVISSDLIRSVATADAIAQGRLRLPHDPRLREIDFGDWDGVHFSKIAEDYPDLSRQFWERPGDIQAPNGESWNMAADRARPFVDRVNADAPPAMIVVAHFGMILIQLQRALGVDAAAVLAHKIDNFSITHLRHTRGRWGVETINHLP